MYNSFRPDDIGGLPAESVQRSMRLFATEVMPALAPARV